MSPTRDSDTLGIEETGGGVVALRTFGERLGSPAECHSLAGGLRAVDSNAQAVKRRERMTEAERVEYDRAVEWASFAEGFGTGAETPILVPTSDEVSRQSDSAQTRG